MFLLPCSLVLIWSFSLTPGKKVHLVLVTFNREYRDFAIIFISLPKYVWCKRCLWYIILVLDLIIDMYTTYVMPSENIYLVWDWHGVSSKWTKSSLRDICLLIVRKAILWEFLLV